MQPRIVMLFCGLVLVGCAPSYTWVKTGGADNNYYQASSSCQALSMGATPMDYSNSGTSTTYHSGTVYGSSGNSGTYSGTSTTYNNNTGQAFANLGKSIRRQQLFNDCMRGQGFTPQSELRQAVERKYLNVPKEITEWNEYPLQISEASISDSYDEIPLKAKPSHRSSVNQILKTGDKVQVIAGAADSWIKVMHNNQQGYLAKKWVTPSDGQEWAESPVTKGTETKAERKEHSVPFEKAKATHDETPLKFKPSSTSSSLNFLQEGEIVEVLGGVADTWIKVRFKRQIGYVDKSSISLFTPTESEKAE